MANEGQPRKSTVREALPWVFLSSVLAAVLVLWGQKTFQRESPLAPIPPRVVPAQVLRMADRSGKPLAELEIRADSGLNGLSLKDGAGNVVASLDAYSTGDCTLQLLGSTPGSSVSVSMKPHPNFLILAPNKRSFTILSKDWKRIREGLAGRLLAMGETAGTMVYQQLFAGGARTAVDKVIPTQDLRLTDKAGRTFAVLGLSGHGGPCMGFTDRDDRLLGSWCLPGRSGSEQGSSEINLFDNEGQPRVHVDLEVGQAPNVWIFEAGELGPYVLDADAGEVIPLRAAEKKPGAGAILWLRGMARGAALPVTLFDQRDRVLWTAP